MSVWRLDGFTEVGELGRGAHGRVVLAQRGRSGPFVAIKYVHTGDDGRVRVPSQHEAQLLASIDDKHVARFHQLVESSEGTALVMEAVEGVSLQRVLLEHGVLEPEAALLVLKGSLLGLAAAHSAGVVHRDYKPANVIVRADGVSKLIDFGVATVSGQRSAAGTPIYMAPEQWSDEPATSATDVYAATCVFFECITGHPPYAGDTQMALMAQHTTAAIPVDEVPEALRELVRHGMAKDAVRRPSDAARFLAELEAAAMDACGEGWERRGLMALAAAAAALAALFPRAATTVSGTAVAETTLGANTPTNARWPGRARYLAMATAVVVVTGGAAGTYALTAETKPIHPVGRYSPLPPSEPAPSPATPTPTPGPATPKPTPTAFRPIVNPPTFKPAPSPTTAKPTPKPTTAKPTPTPTTTPRPAPSPTTSPTPTASPSPIIIW